MATIIEPALTKAHPSGHGEQRLYRFDNGYGASVVRSVFVFDLFRGVGTYGATEGKWEMAVIAFRGDDIEQDWDITYDTPVTDDVIGWLDEDGIQEKLRQIQALPKPGGES